MPLWKRRNWDEEVDEKYGDYYQDGPKRARKSFIPHLIGIGITGGLFLGAAGLVGGRTMFEKTLTALAAPCGILWLALLILVYFSFLHKYRGAAILGLLAFVFLTLAGNRFVANELVRYQEKPFIGMDVLKLEAFDTVFLLGGGTGTRVNGSSQANSNGDRVVTCARMYHAGLIRNIVCTGTQSLRSTEEDLHPSEEARQILIDLDVPEHLVTMMRGNNTSQEMQNIRKWLDANPEPGRIGILTSAWHLSRAKRLAKANGIDAESIPSNFKSEPFAPGPDLLIPSAHNLERSTLIFKEILAGFVGR